jgi:hypothetical protein
VVKIEKLYCSIESAVSILASAGQSREVLTEVAPMTRVWRRCVEEEKRGDGGEEESRARAG